MSGTNVSPSFCDATSPVDTGLDRHELGHHELGRMEIHDIHAADPAARAATAGTAEVQKVAASTAEVQNVAAGTAEVQKVAAELRGVKLALLSDQELLEAARDVEAAVRCLYGVQVRLAGEIAARGVDGLIGARSAAHVLTQILRITAGEAKARIAAASIALVSESLTGVEIEARVPELAKSIDDGVISDAHAKVITSCTAALPQQLDAETRTMCLKVLLDEAKHSDPNRLRRVAEHIRQICDPDGTLDDKQPFDRAELHFGQTRSDGLTPYRGLADPLTMAQLRAAVDDLSRPCPIDKDTPDPRPAPVRRAQAFHEVLRRYLAGVGNNTDAAASATSTASAVTSRNDGGSSSETSTDSVADSDGTAHNAPSSPAQRDNGPRNGGVRPQIGITINIADLLGKYSMSNGARGTGTGSGSASGAASGVADAGSGDGIAGIAGATDRTNDGTCSDAAESWASPFAKTSDPNDMQVGQFDHGAPVDRRTAQLLACDSDLIRLLTGADGAVVDVGRAVRLFTRAQRRALMARDKGCAFPHCDVPATWCEAHHITYWVDGGKTDLDNGVLLCRRHHTIIHQQHWRIAGAIDTAIPNGMRSPGASARSRPWFIPPLWIDPDQRPRRNNHFFLPHIITAVMRR